MHQTRDQRGGQRRDVGADERKQGEQDRGEPVAVDERHDEIAGRDDAGDEGHHPAEQHEYAIDVAGAAHGVGGERSGGVEMQRQ